MHRPENYDIMPKGLNGTAKRKFPFALFSILILVGYLSWEFTPLGIVFLITFPLFSLATYYGYIPIKSSYNLHLWILILVLITSIVVGIRWEKQLLFISKPFVEGSYQDIQIIKEENGSIYWENVHKFVTNNKKEKTVMKMLELTLLAIVVVANSISYFVNKLYEKRNPKATN